MAILACRAVDLALGSPINSFVITARECTRALARDRLAHRPGMFSRLAIAVDMAAVEVRMATLRLLTWLADLEVWLRGGTAAGDDGGSMAEQQQAALATA